MVEEIRQSWRDNKFLLGVFGVVIAGLLAWGIWVTKGVFASAFNETTLKTMCDDVDRMKKIDEALKLQATVLESKFAVQTLRMDANQREIMENQAQIMREMKKR